MSEEIKLKELEATKINLKEGDVLMVTAQHDDISQGSLELLQKTLNSLFPNNKVMLFGMGSEGFVKFHVVSQAPISYCQNCDCGKKELAEKQIKENENESN